jgi:hypothetical protein
MGFGSIWRKIISGLLLTSSTIVFMNGIPGETIQHKRGLRQGDHLSPMLFILTMDVLGFLIVKAENEGLLQPLSTSTLMMWYFFSYQPLKIYLSSQMFYMFLVRPLVCEITYKSAVSSPSDTMMRSKIW